METGWEDSNIYLNLLRMKLLISAHNVKKNCFLEVNQLSAHWMRVLRCHIEPVYCLCVPGRWYGWFSDHMQEQSSWSCLASHSDVVVPRLLASRWVVLRLRNVQLGTADLLDVQKILTYEIYFFVFMVNLMALKIGLLMFSFSRWRVCYFGNICTVNMRLVGVLETSGNITDYR